MPLDRPFLEVIEEEAMVDDQALSLLTEEIYPHPRLLSLLTRIHLGSSTNISDTPPT